MIAPSKLSCPDSLPSASENEAQQREDFILQYMPLVRAIAARLKSSLPAAVELDDLIQAGTLGLLDAAKKYDAGKAVSFSIYASCRIRGAILDSLRDLDWASRGTRRRRKQIESVVEELTATLGRNPSDTEIASRLNLTLEQWHRQRAKCARPEVISASQYDDPDRPRFDLPDRRTPSPESLCERRQSQRALAIALAALPERHRLIFQLYYFEQRTMREIGSILKINESRVSQIHKAALAKMAVALQAPGGNTRASLERPAA